MNQIGEFLGQYATKEVLTVMGALATTWLGWKTAKGSYSLIANIAKKASFMGLVSVAMLAVGFGITGFGVGEINSRPSLKEVSTSPTAVGMSNKDLLEIVKGDLVNPQIVQAILEYAKVRDEKVQQAKSSPQESVLIAEELAIDPVKEATANAEESIVSLPIAWSLIGIGIASSISGVAVFMNRHNKRSSDDPNHPNFEAQYKRA